MAKRRLTDQQRRRIREQIEKRQQQLERRTRRHLADIESGMLNTEQEGLVITHYGHSLAIEDRHGELHHCVARQNIGTPVCGDRVVWQSADNNEGVITAILPRKSLLKRPGFADQLKPVAANITLICIVFAPRPEPQEELIDRYLVATEYLGIQPLLLINKSDLLSRQKLDEWKQRFSIYEKIGYEVHFASTKQADGFKTLIKRLRNNTSILVGQSGVGKSSLVNVLLPDQAIKTQSLSKLNTLGQHTTSNSTLYHLPGNIGNLIDSPGVRDFRLGHLEREDIEQGFIEFRPFLGKCRFSDCKHQSEPGCAIKAAVEEGLISARRLDHYFDLVSH
ncbi:MAG: small ribosomal subunit biogenesis GTPase RsgA [Gammaproteobacteria bacterium]|nr:MAG: small ribosomal subunit biogenesis GTPase RsgA [Gammaproteobacteria bacterium]